MESVSMAAWSGVTEMTTEVVGFWQSSGLGFKYLAEVMIAPCANPMASFIVR
jgi:hypothetical protein